ASYRVMHGVNYQGHPVGTSAVNACLHYLEGHRLFERLNPSGKNLRAALAPLEKHPHVGDIRGLGLLLGVEFLRDKATREPFLKSHNTAEKVGQAAEAEGVLTYPTQGGGDGHRGEHALRAPRYPTAEADPHVVQH